MTPTATKAKPATDTKENKTMKAVLENLNKDVFHVDMNLSLCALNT